jgi:hypothetical protein
MYAQRNGEIQAGHTRHSMVGNDKIRVQAFLHDRESLLCGMGFDHLMSQVLEQSRTRRDQDVIVDQQYRRRSGCGSGRFSMN